MGVAVDVWRERMRFHAEAATVQLIVDEREEAGACLPHRRSRMRFEDSGPAGAPMLHAALQRLADRFGACPPLNLWVRTAPRGAEQFCWRIDLLPRMLHSAGLERATGLHVNVVAPERAAAELREV